MKKTFIFLSLLSALNSCSKRENDPTVDNPGIVPPSYLGIYTSSTNDTVKVLQNGNYTKLVFRTYESIHTPVPAPTIPTTLGVQQTQIQKTFDSIRVASDLTFTNNEISETYIYFTGSIFPLPPPYSYTETAVGTGSFGTNIIQFHMSINGSGYFDFNGVKL